jgi:uncharacterized damage-inducible protein DinB
MTFAQMFLPEFDMEMANTRKMLERVPDGKFDFKPHEKSMTLGRLAAHTCEIPSYATATIRYEKVDFTGEEKPFSPETRKEILDAFDKYVVEAREMLSKVSEEDLLKTWTLTYKGNEIFSMPRTAVLRSMVMGHLIHHRSQLGVYLRLNNVEIPGMYGPSADEMKMFNAQRA